MHEALQAASPAVASGPYSAGWLSAASALYAARDMPVGIALRLVVDDHPPLVIDPHAERCWHDEPIDDLPTRPSVVRVSTTSLSSEHVTQGLGSPLDPLAWMIGTVGFSRGPAPWLRPDDRYRLKRWPDLTLVPYSAEQLRMVALLGNGLLSTRDLAELGDSSADVAEGLINAFTLMGVVSSERGPLRPPPMTAAEPWAAGAAAPARAGLLGRLLSRLGR